MMNGYGTGGSPAFDLTAPVRAAAQHEFVSAQGVTYRTADGEEFVDLNEMRVVLGQGNAAFAQAITDALGGITAQKACGFAAKDTLLHALDRTTGGRFRAAHLTASGSESVESALRLAKKHTGRTEVICFWNSIHGRTYLAGSASGVSARKAGYGPLAPGLVYFPYPSPDLGRRLGGALTPESYISLIDEIYRSTSAMDAAAMLVEPYQANGVIFPAPGYLQALRAWAREHGILFIADEVQSGMGRTGDLYVSLAEDLDPDMLLLGKGLGNGFHISALLTKVLPETQDLRVFSGGSGDDPLACAAACEVFRQLQGGLLAHTADAGRALGAALARAQAFPVTESVRSKGLAGAVDLTSPAVCDAAAEGLRRRGFLAGKLGRTLFVKPAYVVTDAQLEAFGTALCQVLAAL